MNSFKQMIDGGLAVWKDTTPAAKIGIGLLAVLCISLIGFVGYWSYSPNYVNLVTDIDHDKMANVIDALEKAGIDYELGGAGGVLKVDNRQFAKARMIARGQGVSVTDAEETSAMGNMWLDPTDRKQIEIRKKESSLAASISKFDVIEAADVHLNVPVKGPFERKTSQPSASVLLTLSPGQRLADHQASSIASLVAYAVQDLDPQAVQITDKSGTNYTVDDELSSSISNQVDFVATSESKLERKAESLLYKILGFENASVQVSLDLTFPNGSRKTTTYDSKGKVPSTENTTLDTTKTQLPEPSSDLDVTKKLETINTEYLVPKTEETEANTTPIRNFMSVAVIVNSSSDGIQDENGAITANIKTQIEDIVKNAVGYREKTDSLSVEFLEFATIESSLPASTPINWIEINKLVQNVSLSVAAIAAVLFGFMTLRKFRPSWTPKPVELDAGRKNSVGTIAQLAQSDPETFAKIMKGWATAGTESTENDVDKPNKQAA